MTTPEAVLENRIVIDLTHYIAGPYCTKLLAGFGADVIKVERPERGDLMRSLGPFYRGQPGIERSIPFLWLNTGKKSITLNLKNDQGREMLLKLIGKADILIENYSRKTAREFDLSYETLRRTNPRLVMTSISNFGERGPYRDYKAEEIITYAMSGGMYLTGDPSRPPLNAGPAVTQYTAGMNAYIGTLIALYHRYGTGRGQHVEVSIQESAIDNIEIKLTNSLQRNITPKRDRDRHPMVPWELYECSDGHAAVISGPLRHWRKAAEIFDDPRLFEQRYDHCRDRIRLREEYEDLLRPAVLKHQKGKLFQEAQKRNLAFGYLNSLPEAMELPQHENREFFVDIDHPVTGIQKYAGAPFRLEATPWRDRRAPELGEHNSEVYGDLLGLSVEEIDDLRRREIIG
jgi:crotonobetainyl-CoA:carnitine CoA-transferase CaiB-like acyl-CoA transferase